MLNKKSRKIGNDNRDVWPKRSLNYFRFAGVGRKSLGQGYTFFSCNWVRQLR